MAHLLMSGLMQSQLQSGIQLQTLASFSFNKSIDQGNYDSESRFTFCRGFKDRDF